MQHQLTIEQYYYGSRKRRQIPLETVLSTQLQPTINPKLGPWTQQQPTLRFHIPYLQAKDNQTCFFVPHFVTPNLEQRKKLGMSQVIATSTRSIGRHNKSFCRIVSRSISLIGFTTPRKNTNNLSTTPSPRCSIYHHALGLLSAPTRLETSRPLSNDTKQSWSTLDDPNKEKICLSKLIASSGLNMQMSRKSAKMLIQAGQVTIVG